MSRCRGACDGHLAEHDVESVHDRGWDGLKNGALLQAAEGEFDVVVTADQNLPHQQNLSKFRLRVVVLAGVSNRLRDLIALVPSLLACCEKLEEGQVAIVRWQDV